MTSESAAGRERHFVQSLERGLAVIRALSDPGPGLTLADVARHTGLTRAAARRFLLTLEDLGYVRSADRRFSLTARVLELGYSFLSSLTLPEIAQPHLRELVGQVHESSSVSVLDGAEVVYVAREPTQRIMTVAISVGTRFPAYATSMGRVLLAGLDEPELDTFLQRAELRPLTAETVTDVERAARGARARARAGLGDRRPGARGRPAVGRRADPQPGRAGRRGDQPVGARQPANARGDPASAAAAAARNGRADRTRSRRLEAAVNVRDAAFDVMRRFGMTTIFGNPGSTEITFLTDLPSDFTFMLGLHEGSVVGIASGYAIARGAPAFVNLHTAPGLGNAVNAIANARDCRAPLVIVVGQQDRRQMTFEPFLTGRALERVAGDYPVWSSLPVRPQDVPGAIGRAYHEALAARGPALVVVPMGDWLEEADPLAAGVPAEITRASAVAEADVERVGELVRDSERPALVVGAGTDTHEGWDAVVALAERLGSPVWQEAFGNRAGFPQDHPLFAGHLPWMRWQMQERLSAHDLVIAIGTGAFRAYLFDQPVALVAPGTRVAVITHDPAEAHRSPCDVAVVAPVAAACSALASLVEPADSRWSRRVAARPPSSRSGPAAATGTGRAVARGSCARGARAPAAG